MERLPTEIIEKIVLSVAYHCALPSEAFRIATALRLQHVQCKLVPFTPLLSMDAASERGQLGLLCLYLQCSQMHSRNYSELDLSRHLVARPHGIWLDLNWSARAMDGASGHGHVEVLEWWKCSGLELKYTENAVDSASEFGHVHVLNWWLKSGLEFAYTECAMDKASSRGHVDILEWWKSSNLELKWTNNAVDSASLNGRIEVLDWWKYCGLELKHSKWLIDCVSASGSAEVLQWWRSSGLKIVYTEDAIDFASTYRNIEALDWWKSSTLELKWTPSIVIRSMQAYAEVSDWWEGSKLTPRHGKVNGALTKMRMKKIIAYLARVKRLSSMRNQPPTAPDLIRKTMPPHTIELQLN